MFVNVQYQLTVDEFVLNLLKEENITVELYKKVQGTDAQVRVSWQRPSLYVDAE